MPVRDIIGITLIVPNASADKILCSVIFEFNFNDPKVSADGIPDNSILPVTLIVPNASADGTPVNTTLLFSLITPNASADGIPDRIILVGLTADTLIVPNVSADGIPVNAILLFILTVPNVSSDDMPVSDTVPFTLIVPNVSVDDMPERDITFVAGADTVIAPNASAEGIPDNDITSGLPIPIIPLLFTYSNVPVSGTNQIPEICTSSKFVPGIYYPANVTKPSTNPENVVPPYAYTYTEIIPVSVGVKDNVTSSHVFMAAVIGERVSVVIP